MSIPIPHSKPSFISFTSSFKCFKEVTSPSAICSSSLITRAWPFRTILPSKTFDPAIKPIFGILKDSWTVALPNIFSTFSGSNNPSTANVTSSTAW